MANLSYLKQGANNTPTFYPITSFGNFQRNRIGKKFLQKSSGNFHYDLHKTNTYTQFLANLLNCDKCVLKHKLAWLIYQLAESRKTSRTQNFKTKRTTLLCFRSEYDEFIHHYSPDLIIISGSGKRGVSCLVSPRKLLKPNSSNLNWAISLGTSLLEQGLKQAGGLIDDYMASIASDITLFVTNLCTLVLNAILFFTTEGALNTTLLAASITSSAIGFFHSLYRLADKMSVPLNKEKINSKLETQLMDAINDTIPNAGLEELDAVKWLKRIFAVIITFLVFGMTKCGFMEAKTVTDTSLLVRSITTFTGAFNEVSKEVADMLGLAEATAGFDMGSRLEKISNELAKILSTPLGDIMCNMDLIQRIDTINDDAMALIKESDKDEKGKYVSLKATIVARLNTLDNRRMEVHQCIGASYRIDPGCFVFYGKPAVGKTYLLELLTNELAAELRLSPKKYSLKRQPGGKHYNTYCYEQFAIYDEFLRDKGEDEILSDFNQLFSTGPVNLTGASIPEKRQFVRFHGAFLAGNTAPAQMANQLTSWTRETQDAFFSRQMWFHVEDIMNPQRNVPQPHRRPDMSHLTIRYKHFEDWTTERMIRATPEQHQNPRNRYPQMKAIIKAELIRRELEYWNNGMAFGYFTLPSVLAFRQERIDFLTRHPNSDVEPREQSTSSSSSLPQFGDDVADVKRIAASDEGNRFFSIRFQGPPNNGKTRLARKLGNYLAMAHFMPFKELGINTHLKALDDLTRPVVVLFDDIHPDQTMLESINALPKKSIIIHCTHHNFYTRYDNAAKKIASKAFTKIMRRPVELDNHYIQTYFDNSLCSMGRRLGAAGIVENICPNTHKVTRYTTPYEDGVTFHVTTTAQMKELVSNQSFMPNQICDYVSEKYLKHLQTNQEIRVVEEYPENEVAGDIKIQASTRAKLIDVLTDQTKLITAFTGYDPECSIKVDDNTMNIVSSKFQIEDYLLFSKDLSDDNVVDALERMAINLTRMYASAEFSIRTSDFAAYFARGTLYVPTLEVMKRVEVTEHHDNLLFTIKDNGAAYQLDLEEASILLYKNIPRIPINAAVLFRRWYMSNRDDLRYARLRSRYEVQTNNLIALTKAKKITEDTKEQPWFVYIAAIIFALLGLLFVSQMVRYVYNYVSTTKPEIDVVKLFEHDANVPTVQLTKERYDRARDYINIHGCPYPVHSSSDYDACILKVLETLDNNKTYKRVEPNAIPWMSNEEYQKLQQAREARDRSSMGPTAHEEWRSIADTKYGKMILEEEQNIEDRTQRRAQRATARWDYQANSLKKYEPLDRKTNEFESKADLVEKNVGIVASSCGSCHAIGLKEHQFLTVAHVFDEVGQICSFKSDETGTVYARVLAISRPRDLALCEIYTPDTRKFRDLSPHLATEDMIMTMAHGWFVRYEANQKIVDGSITPILGIVQPHSVKPRFEPTDKYIDFVSVSMEPSDKLFKEGDCGYPLFGELKGKVYLIGLHNATSKYDSTFSYISTEDLVDLQKTLQHPTYRFYKPNAIVEDDLNGLIPVAEKHDISLLVHPKIDELMKECDEPNFDPLPGIKNHGRHKRLIDYSKDESKLRYLGDKGLENKNLSGPSVTNVNDVRLKDTSGLLCNKNGKPSIAMTQFAKFGLGADRRKGVDMDVLRHATMHVDEYYNQHYGELRILSFREAVNGFSTQTLQGTRGSNALDMTKSSGPTYALLYNVKTKSQLFKNVSPPGLQPFYVVNDSPAGKLCSTLVKTRMKLGPEGIGVIGMNKGCLKVELRPLEKIEVGNTRLFNSVDTDIVIFQTMLYGDLLSKMMEHHMTCVSCIGCNPYRDFTGFRKYIDEIDGEDFWTDYKNFDKTIWLYFKMALAKCVAGMVKDRLTPEELEYLYKSEAVSTAFMISIVEAHMLSIINGDGNFSGNKITQLINDRGNHTDTIYAILRKLQIIGRPLVAPYYEVEKSYRAKTQGDDKLARYARYLRMTLEFLIQCSKELGFELTPADKAKGELQMYLSRSMIPDARHGVVFPALKKISILHTLHYVPSLDPIMIASAFNTTLFEAAFWDEDFYNSVKRDIAKQIAKFSKNIATLVKSHYQYEDYKQLRYRIMEYIRFGNFPAVSHAGLVIREEFTEQKQLLPNSFNEDNLRIEFTKKRKFFLIMSNPITNCNLWYQHHPEQTRPTETWRDVGDEHCHRWECRLVGILSIGNVPSYDFVSTPGPNKKQPREEVYGRLWQILERIVEVSPVLDSRLEPSDVSTLLKLQDLMLLEKELGSTEILNIRKEIDASDAVLNTQKYRDEYRATMEKIKKSYNEKYFPLKPNSKEPTPIEIAEALNQLCVPGESFEVISKDMVVASGTSLNAGAIGVRPPAPDLAQKHIVKDLEEQAFQAMRHMITDVIPIVWKLKPNKRSILDEGICETSHYCVDVNQIVLPVWVFDEEGTFMINMKLYTRIFKSKERNQLSPNMDRAETMAPPVGEIISQAPRATSMSSATPTNIPAEATTLGMVGSIDRPNVPSTYASSDQTSQSVALEIPANTPNMLNFNLNVHNIWGYATRMFDNGRPLVISGQQVSGTIVGVYKYGLNVPDMQPYARFIGLLHRAYSGPTYYEYDMQGVPMLKGSIIIGVVRRAPPPTQTTIEIATLQKIAWVEITVSDTQTHTVKLNDARKNNFFREIADDVGDMLDRPAIVIAIHHPIENQFPEGSDSVSIRVRSCLDPVEFSLGEPIDVEDFPSVFPSLQDQDNCGNRIGLPRPVNGLRIRDLFPGIHVPITMITDGPYHAVNTIGPASYETIIRTPLVTVERDNAGTLLFIHMENVLYASIVSQFVTSLMYSNIEGFFHYERIGLNGTTDTEEMIIEKYLGTQYSDFLNTNPVGEALILLSNGGSNPAPFGSVRFVWKGNKWIQFIRVPYLGSFPQNGLLVPDPKPMPWILVNTNNTPIEIPNPVGYTTLAVTNFLEPTAVVPATFARTSVPVWGPFYDFLRDICENLGATNLVLELVSTITNTRVVTMYYNKQDNVIYLYEPGQTRQYKFYPITLEDFTIANLRGIRTLENIGTDTMNWIDRQTTAFARNQVKLPNLEEEDLFVKSTAASSSLLAKFKRAMNTEPNGFVAGRYRMGYIHRQPEDSDRTKNHAENMKIASMIRTGTTYLPPTLVERFRRAMNIQPNGQMLAGMNFQNSSMGAAFDFGADQIKGKQARDFYQKMMREGFSHQEAMAKMQQEFQGGLFDKGLDFGREGFANQRNMMLSEQAHNRQMQANQQQHNFDMKLGGIQGATWGGIGKLDLTNKQNSGRNGARGMIHATANAPGQILARESMTNQVPVVKQPKTTRSIGTSTGTNIMKNQATSTGTNIGTRSIGVTAALANKNSTRASQGTDPMPQGVTLPGATRTSTNV